MTSEDRDELRRLRVEVRQLREMNSILRSATIFFAGNSTPASVDRGVRAPDACLWSCRRVDFACPERCGAEDRGKNTADLAIPAAPIAARIVTDTTVEDTIRALAFTRPSSGEQVLATEGLCGRRKRLAAVRRGFIPDAGFASVDRAMRSLGSAMSSSVAGPVRRSRPRKMPAPRTC